jgi:glucose-1-phosphatase
VAGINNIIFDIGNVLVDIDLELMCTNFSLLSKKYSALEIADLLEEDRIWIRYEKGFLTDIEFRKEISKLLDLQATDQQFDHAFNSIILDIDSQRIRLVEALSKKYNLYVLSNTSAIHMDYFLEQIHEQCGIENFWLLFKKPYLSYEMGHRKPSESIYNQVLSKSGLKPEETLFLDDLLPNIEAAQALGIQCMHVQKPNTIIDYLHEMA